MAKPSVIDLAIIKRPHSRDDYTEKDLVDLARCVDDPMFFMRNFMKIQHPTKGAISFDPYSYQERIVNAFSTHRNTIAMTARQLGKCNTFDTNINVDGKSTKIGKILRYSLREKIVNILEKWLIFLSK